MHALSDRREARRSLADRSLESPFGQTRSSFTVERSLIRRQLGGSGGEDEDREGQSEQEVGEEEYQARYERLCDVNFLSFGVKAQNAVIR